MFVLSNLPAKTSDIHSNCHSRGPNPLFRKERPVQSPCLSNPGVLQRIRVPLAALAAGLVTSLAGCMDSRISMQELQSREVELATTSQPATAKPARLNLTEIKRYKIQNGDVLNLTMVGIAAAVDTAAASTYTPTIIRVRVDPSGAITLPLVGAVRVAGLDYAQAESAVLGAHSKLISKPFSVNIELVGPENTTVIVTGAAELPGLITLPQNERNILYALAKSGAFGLSASGVVRFKPISPDREEVVYDLNNIDDVRAILVSAPLESGDVLSVEAADANVVYVSGLTNAPGAIPVPRNGSMSLMRAIAAAGGTREYIEVKEATLVRRLRDGSQVRAKVDVKKIFDGEEPDIALVAGDVLQLPHTLDTRFQDWVSTNVLRQFSIGVRYDPLQQYNTDRIIDRQSLNGGNLRNSVLLNLSNLLLPTPAAPTP